MCIQPGSRSPSLELSVENGSPDDLRLVPRWKISSLGVLGQGEHKSSLVSR